MTLKQIAALIVFIVSSSLQDSQSAEPAAEFGAKAVQYVQSLPDCRFLYTASREGSPADYDLTVEFCKSNGMFYFKQVGSYGEVLDFRAYDGKTYYWLDSGGRLVMASDFSRISSGFVGAFMVNPLYSPYYHLFIGKDDRFALPFLNDASLWTTALSGFEPAAEKTTSKPGEVTLARDNQSYLQSVTFNQDRPYPTSATFRLKEQNYLVEWKVLEELSIPLDQSGRTLRIPGKTNQTRTTANSTVAPPAYTNVTIQPGTFQLLKEQLPDILFRVSPSSARRLINADLPDASK